MLNDVIVVLAVCTDCTVILNVKTFMYFYFNDTINIISYFDHH